MCSLKNIHIDRLLRMNEYVPFSQCYVYSSEERRGHNSKGEPACRNYSCSSIYRQPKKNTRKPEELNERIRSILIVLTFTHLKVGFLRYG